MIEIFETCQTESIAKQTNRDESLLLGPLFMILICKFFPKEIIDSLPS